jgi:hypothetical protein
MLYAALNAPLRPYPYPHFHVENAIDQATVDRLRAARPGLEAFRSITETGRVNEDETTYRNRSVITLSQQEADAFPEGSREVWRDVHAQLSSNDFVLPILQKFDPWLRQRFGDKLPQLSFRPDIQLVTDRSHYSLGPHTDHPSKVVVLLLYLPEDESRPELGTSIYQPREAGFVCQGGPHYEHDRFRRLFSASYKPGTMLGFLKTANSFHGVEPVPENVPERFLIQYSIKVEG